MRKLCKFVLTNAKYQHEKKNKKKIQKEGKESNLLNNKL